MSDTQNKVQVKDAITGKEYERDMTAEEIAAIPEARDDLES